jgi:hypothetical protein
MHQLLGLSDMKANTQWAPLAVLGYRLQQRKFFEPLYQQLDLHQKHLRYTSQDKLITCLVSIMSGCQSISHINTRIRPDRALAQAWGLEYFAHQSIVADTLNHFTARHVAQLRQAVNTIYLREGRAVQHDYTSQGFLILDVDLTGLPASKHAEGSRKGYFSGKKGGVDDNLPASVLLSIMKICSVSCIQATRLQKRAYLKRFNSLKYYYSSMIATNEVVSWFA